MSGTDEKDFLDEMIDDEKRRNRGFSQLLDAAIRKRDSERDLVRTAASTVRPRSRRAATSNDPRR